MELVTPYRYQLGDHLDNLMLHSWEMDSGDHHTSFSPFSCAVNVADHKTEDWINGMQDDDTSVSSLDKVEDLYKTLAKYVITAWIDSSRKPLFAQSRLAASDAVRVHHTPSAAAISDDKAQGGQISLKGREEVITAARAAGDNDSDDEDGDERDHRKRHDTEREGLECEYPVSQRVWACPFFKYDPERFALDAQNGGHCRSCSKFGASDISRLKQHLYRCHKEPQHFCSNCFAVFKDESSLDEHSKQEPGCDARDTPFLDPIDLAHIQAALPNRNKMSAELRWYEIYKILFPNGAIPLSPYAFEEPFPFILRTFIQDQLVQSLSDNLVENGVLTDGSAILRAEDALRSSLEVALEIAIHACTGMGSSLYRPADVMKRSSTPDSVSSIFDYESESLSQPGLDQGGEIVPGFEASAVRRIIHTWAIQRMLRTAGNGSSSSADASGCNAGTTAKSQTAQKAQASQRKDDGKRKAPDDDDDDDIFDGDGKNPRYEPQARLQGSDKSKRRLRCPYHIRWPKRYSENNQIEMNYRGCSSVVLADISRLKQHLRRVHQRPQNYCGRCYSVFKSHNAFDIHQQLERCAKTEPQFTERMTEEQCEAVRQRNLGTTVRERYNNIYYILFPDSDPPNSPYIADIYEDFLNFMRYQVPGILQTDLINQGLVQNTPGQRRLLYNVIRDAMMQVAASVELRVDPSVGHQALSDLESGFAVSAHGQLESPLSIHHAAPASPSQMTSSSNGEQHPLQVLQTSMNRAQASPQFTPPDDRRELLQDQQQEPWLQPPILLWSDDPEFANPQSALEESEELSGGSLGQYHTPSFHASGHVFPDVNAAGPSDWNLPRPTSSSATPTVGHSLLTSAEAENDWAETDDLEAFGGAAGWEDLFALAGQMLPMAVPPFQLNMALQDADERIQRATSGERRKEGMVKKQKVMVT